MYPRVITYCTCHLWYFVSCDQVLCGSNMLICAVTAMAQCEAVDCLSKRGKPFVAINASICSRGVQAVPVKITCSTAVTPAKA